MGGFVIRIQDTNQYARRLGLFLVTGFNTTRVLLADMINIIKLGISLQRGLSAMLYKVYT